MDAPLAVRMPVVPLQMVIVVEATEGNELTVTVVATVLLQPWALMPVTLYTVLDVGDTVIEDAAPPGDQVYEMPPFPPSTADCP